ncbi:hypothetical protein C0J52_23460 [Blattella germanica]|nr:hypothetical protein C0J52_23460 [Blattella germanica]
MVCVDVNNDRKSLKHQLHSRGTKYRTVYVKYLAYKTTIENDLSLTFVVPDDTSINAGSVVSAVFAPWHGSTLASASNIRPRGCRAQYKLIIKQDLEENGLQQAKIASKFQPTNDSELWSDVVKRKQKTRPTVVGTKVINEKNNVKLKGVSKVHVYRLAPDTTIDELTEYLKPDIPIQLCEKLNSRNPQYYSSFRIDISEEYQEIAFKPEIWPGGACWYLFNLSKSQQQFQGDIRTTKRLIFNVLTIPECIAVITWRLKDVPYDELRQRFQRKLGKDGPANKTTLKLLIKFKRTGNVADESRPGRLSTSPAMESQGGILLFSQIVDTLVLLATFSEHSTSDDPADDSFQNCSPNIIILNQNGNAFTQNSHDFTRPSYVPLPKSRLESTEGNIAKQNEQSLLQNHCQRMFLVKTLPDLKRQRYIHQIVKIVIQYTKYNEPVYAVLASDVYSRSTLREQKNMINVYHFRKADRRLEIALDEALDRKPGTHFETWRHLLGRKECVIPQKFCSLCLPNALTFTCDL